MKKIDESIKYLRGLSNGNMIKQIIQIFKTNKPFYKTIKDYDRKHCTKYFQIVDFGWIEKQ